MMKKIISGAIVAASLASALPAFATEGAMTTSINTTSQATVIACIAPAVATREAAVAAAFATFSGAQSAALTARASALQAAWALTTNKEVRTAVNKAWTDYRTAHKAAVKAHTTAVNTAWSTFRTARKACKPGVTVPVEAQSTSDNSLAQ